MGSQVGAEAILGTEVILKNELLDLGESAVYAASVLSCPRTTAKLWTKRDSNMGIIFEHLALFECFVVTYDNTVLQNSLREALSRGEMGSTDIRSRFPESDNPDYRSGCKWARSA